MTLQGDLNSFALPDVLRLLAGTSKSGRFEVRSDRSTGELGLELGQLCDAQLNTAPPEASTAEILFEMLRLDAGSFSFEERDPSGDGGGTDVEVVLAEASALVLEWEAVEAVVPSLDSWLTLVPQIEDAAVEVTAERWRTLAAIGSGSTPAQLTEALDQGALLTCQSVKDLVELALVEVGDVVPGAGAATPVVRDLPMPEVELESFDEYEDPELTGLEDLAAEDGPVVMEDREDALLPEPLPGEGVVYDGEPLTGVVDGRTEPEPEPEPQPEPEPEPEPAAGFEATGEPEFHLDPEPLEDLQPQPAMAEAAPVPDPQPMAYDDQPTIDEPIAHDELAEASAFANGMSPEAGDGEDGHEDEDDERGSLMRFLSTVKP